MNVKQILRLISLCFIVGSTSYFYYAWRFYNPQSPYLTDGLMAGGAIFVLVSLILYYISAATDKKKDYLMKTGTPVETEYQNTQINRHVSVNSQCPYNILTVGADLQGQKRTFKSANIWSNPERHLTKGQKIKVYLDPKNSQKYWVDISFLERNY